jgi:hypothetical protein
MDLLEKFRMAACKPSKTPMDPGLRLEKEGPAIEEGNHYVQLVGALMYAATRTRPDIAFAVGVLSRRMAEPHQQHWLAAKRVLRYLAGTPGYGLMFTKKGVQNITAYGDTDYAGDVLGRKSTSGTVVLKNGVPLAWKSKLQTTVATSTCEAECAAAAQTVKEGLWTRKLMGEITGTVEPVKVYCNNQSALKLRTKLACGIGEQKHVGVAHHFVRDPEMRRDIKLGFVGTEAQQP